ncbi:serine/threonine protein kinase [Hyalangium gracile]|uniref:serine/threonine protein kinase n=1 Tax=Hyalangium gracile TaxID=394092 RepID=UPI001CCC0DE0|nr:serine/threonine-protein kinase [Hyalangium gracile]
MSLTESPAVESDGPSKGASTCPICGARLTEARCAACGAAAHPGGYAVQRLIAQTQHSRVYLARGTQGQEVALKELLLAQIPGTQQLDAFEREARLLETLSHPRIPKLLGHFQEGQGAGLRLYLAAEYVAGETLLDRLSHHAFSEEEAQVIGLQVLELLDYLHGRKPRILHRDIKPANLIRQPDGSIVLVDFGSARESARGATVGSTLVGTFGYMPLEQLGGTVDVTSDLYALGASLVHLLGGTPPSDHFHPDRGLDLGHLEAPVLSTWLRKMTALKPEDRYSSAAAARQALAALKPGGRVPARPVKAAPVALSPDAPAALARLQQEAQAARATTAKSVGRQKREAIEAARGEARDRDKQKARHEDDRLSLLDFYKMASPVFLSPAVLPWVGLLLGTGVYASFPAFDLMPIPALDTVAGIQFGAGVLAASYAALGGPSLIRALLWLSSFRRLPFSLEGLGQLVHRGDGDARKFIRCTLRLRLKETAPSPQAASTLKTAKATALKLAVDRANHVVSRMAGNSEYFQKLRWSVQGDKAEGFANWRVGGLLLSVCKESLAPLQRDLGVLEAVVIEPSDEEFTLPDGD